jgi:hypothetical protein
MNIFFDSFESYRPFSIVAIKNKGLMKEIPSSTETVRASDESIISYNTKLFSQSHNVEFYTYRIYSIHSYISREASSGPKFALL